MEYTIDHKTYSVALRALFESYGRLTERINYLTHEKQVNYQSINKRIDIEQKIERLEGKRQEVHEAIEVLDFATPVGA